MMTGDATGKYHCATVKLRALPQIMQIPAVLPSCQQSNESGHGVIQVRDEKDFQFPEILTSSQLQSRCALQ